MPVFKSVVVSGTPFSGKSTLAKLIAEHFQWKYFSVGDMWRDIWKETVPDGETSFPNFMNMTSDNDNIAMDKKAHDILVRGKVVADLRHGFLHRDPQVLIVFTKCDTDVRVKRALEINKYPGKNFSQVKEILEQRERDEVDRCRRLYGKDYRDPENYDIEFDTTSSPPEVALERILSI